MAPCSVAFFWKTSRRNVWLNGDTKLSLDERPLEVALESAGCLFPARSQRHVAANPDLIPCTLKWPFVQLSRCYQSLALSISDCLFLSISFLLSLYLSLHQSVFPFVYFPICPFVVSSTPPFLHFSTVLFVQPNHLSIHLSMKHLPISGVFEGCHQPISQSTCLWINGTTAIPLIHLFHFSINPYFHSSISLLW